MAKSNGISGIFRGKKGDGVFYKNGNAASAADVQGWRQRAGKVANPKTTAQVSQRMKMTPAVNLYRALAGILDHSWQGVKYGGRSHSEFMKHALNMSDGFPYLEKGDMRPVPGEYLVSTGSLAGMNVVVTDGSPAVLIHPDNFLVDGFLESSTLGDFSQALVASGACSDGDQLTIVYCNIVGSSLDEFRWNYKRIVLDVSSTKTITQLTTELGVTMEVNGDEIAFIPNEQNNVAAGAVIISRPPLRNGAWQRSTTRLTIAPAITAAFMSADALASAQESYKKKESTTTSEWYLNQGSVAGPSAGGSTGGGSNTPGTDNP